MNLVWSVGLGLLAAWAQEPPATAPEEAPPAAEATTSYALTPSGSFLAVVVYKDATTFLSGKAHDHALVASSFEGQVVWGVDDVDACDVRLSFPVSALVVDPAGARNRVGIDPEDTVGESGQRQLKENAMGASQLWAEKHPRIAFQSTGCRARGAGVVVEGNLTIRGASKKVTVSMDVEASPDRFHAKGSFELTHSDFGFTPYSALGGMIANDQRLGFVVDVVGVPQAL